MGILNVTPDSFSDGGRYLAADDAIAHGLRLCADGAAILDVGGESTRPGASRIDAETEKQRVLPVIEALAGAGVLVSVDTMNSATALAAIDAGARIVNDVSGGLADPDMFAAIAPTGADIVISHWRGPSVDMYARAEYFDVAREVAAELHSRAHAAAAAGIAPSRVIVDPGIGFGKTPAQNWALLHGIPSITALGYRVLVGTSRKMFLTRLLGEEATIEQRDLATAVTSVLASARGLWGVRVHNAAATRDAIRVADAWDRGSVWIP